jgi:hypothetical protein
MEIEEWETCANCGEESVMYFHRISNGMGFWCKFYINPYLPMEKVLHVLEGRHETHSDYKSFNVKCPACGSWNGGLGMKWRREDEETMYRPPEEYFSIEKEDIVAIPIKEIKQFAPDAIIYEWEEERVESREVNK